MGTASLTVVVKLENGYINCVDDCNQSFKFFMIDDCKKDWFY